MIKGLPEQRIKQFVLRLLFKQDKCVILQIKNLSSLPSLALNILKLRQMVKNIRQPAKI